MLKSIVNRIEAIDTSDRFKKRIKDTVEKAFKFKKELNFQEVWLFGSVARGTETYDSDIDIMLVSYDRVEREQRMLLDLEGILDEGVSDVFIRSLKVLSNMDEIFNEYIHEEKIVLYKESMNGV